MQIRYRYVPWIDGPQFDEAGTRVVPVDIVELRQPLWRYVVARSGQRMQRSAFSGRKELRTRLLHPSETCAHDFLATFSPVGIGPEKTYSIGVHSHAHSIVVRAWVA